MNKKLLTLIAFSISLLFFSAKPAVAYNRYRERTTAYMSNERISVDFEYIDSTAPKPDRIEVIAKNVFIGFATPYASGTGFKLEMWRGCRDPLYPAFDYVSDWSSYGYYPQSLRFVFVLPGNVRVEQYADYPTLIQEPGGYVTSESELQSYCHITPSGGTTVPPVSGGGDSFLSPLFDLLASFINSILSAIFGS